LSRIFGNYTGKLESAYVCIGGAAYRCPYDTKAPPQTETGTKKKTKQARWETGLNIG